MVVVLSDSQKLWLARELAREQRVLGRLRRHLRRQGVPLDDPRHRWAIWAQQAVRQLSEAAR